MPWAASVYVLWDVPCVLSLCSAPTPPSPLYSQLWPVTHLALTSCLQLLVQGVWSRQGLARKVFQADRSEVLAWKLCRLKDIKQSSAAKGADRKAADTGSLSCSGSQLVGYFRPLPACLPLFSWHSKLIVKASVLPTLAGCMHHASLSSLQACPELSMQYSLGTPELYQHCKYKCFMAIA